MDAKFSARDALRDAHAARDTVRMGLETAVAVHAAGVKLAQATASHLAQCKDRRDAAQSELSTRIAERLRAGKTAELDSAPLAGSEEAFTKANAQHQATQRAVERLAADVESARHNLQAEHARVREAAVGVLGDEATRRAHELIAARVIVSANETWMKAAAGLPLGELGRGLLAAMNAATEIPAFYPQGEAGTARKIRAYLAALELDAAVTFDAIAEPEAPSPVIVGGRFSKPKIEAA